MTDKYITSSQYERGFNKIKEYVDKSIPHMEDPEVIFTIIADKVLEIYNSDSNKMEFDKPSNIDLNNDFIINYNNEDIIVNIKENVNGKYISYYNDDIEIIFYPGIDIDDNINENKMLICIYNLNTDISSSIILKQVKTKYLNNKYLKKDVAIQNSITIGSRRKDNNIGKYSFSNGIRNIALGNSSHAEGSNTKALGNNSHAEGSSTEASGFSSHAEGYDTKASGENSHAEGIGTKASGDGSHAEGFYTTASGNNSHVEGDSTKASGENSHAEGIGTKASGDGSHAEGFYTTASGNNSHVEGDSTKASSENQHVQGKYNIEDTENKYAHIVGNGTDDNTRSNAHTLDWNGNAWFAGKLTQEGTPTDDKDLITKKYFDDNKTTVPTKISELTNDSNFLTAIPEEYVTETELTSKGYLTEHQSLANYATIEYVDSKLITNYVSKEELTESTKPADTTTVKTTLNDILGGDYIE